MAHRQLRLQELFAARQVQVPPPPPRPFVMPIEAVDAFREINEVLTPITRYRLDPIRNLQAFAHLPEPFLSFFRRIIPEVNRITEAIIAGRDYRDDLDDLLDDIEETAPRRQQRELERFVNDRQNVHTVAAVNQTKEVVDRVLKIAVPDEFKYTHSMRTLAEILLEVPMTVPATKWFMTKYQAADSIYEYGPYTYARICDAVWQYIRNSPDKKSLCSIFAVEMQDSINMCAQGNLTRLCNVLAGFMEGVNTESQGEQLQRRMAKLMELDNPEDRVRQGKAVLEELAVPEDQHDVWLEALTA